ncbi:MAG: hypothetical protein KF851_06150 [Pirellulaceae bacterium]|nr:hypothetical protein [Pirellulaceae bacterium]
MKHCLTSLIAGCLLAVTGPVSIAQQLLIDLKVTLQKELRWLDDSSKPPTDSDRFVIPGAGQAKFTYSGDPMVDGGQLFGISLEFPGSASGLLPGSTVDSNEKDRKKSVGQPFVWIWVQEFREDHKGTEVICHLNARPTHKSNIEWIFPAQDALFRVEWLGDGKSGGATHTIAGVWKHGDGGETWTFTANPDGTFKAEEQGFGNARGTAMFSGNKIHIEYTTSDGTNGEYDIILEPDGRSGKGTWTSDLPDSGTRTFTRVEPIAPTQPPTTIDSSKFTIQVAEHRLNPGETKSIPVEVRNPGDVSNLNILLEFDPSVVKVQSKPAVGSVGGQRLFEANFSEPGLVRLGFAGSTGITQDGVLATIPFTAIGTAGNRTPIHAKVTQANRSDGQAIEAQLIPGTIVIVAGGKDSEPVQPPPTVVSPPRTFTTDDALKALRMSVKLLPEDLVLDVDENGQITSNDARVILKRVTKRE